jgi:hypothetical protein
MMAVGKLALAQRRDRYDPAKVADARNELVAVKLEREILRAINPEPSSDYEPLRQEDRARLADILLNG